jgi:hypothetical protein
MKVLDNYLKGYEVTKEGKVFTKAGKEFSYQEDKDGYYKINLSGGERGLQKRVFVHRLVALKFIPNPENLKVVNHKDGDKKNNNVENLEWCTVAYNNKHAMENGLWSPTENKHLRRKVKAVDIKTGETLYFDGRNEAAAAGFNRGQIHRSIKGEVNHHKGYKWSYV